MPTENELTSWYTKFRTATDKWSTGRFDLRVDDDGEDLPASSGGSRPASCVSSSTRASGISRRAEVVKAILRNPRLIRWAVAVDLEPRDVKIVTGDKELAYTFPSD